MKPTRSVLLPAIVASGLLLAASASAQTSMWGGSVAPPGAENMDCNRMVARATSLLGASASPRAAQAQQEISAARQNMQSGNELACRLHAQNALQDLR